MSALDRLPPADMLTLLTRARGDDWTGVCPCCDKPRLHVEWHGEAALVRCGDECAPEALCEALSVDPALIEDGDIVVTMADVLRRDDETPDAEDVPDDDETGRKSQSVRIIEYVRGKYRIIRADDGKLYVVPLAGPRIVTSLTALAARISSDMYADLGVTLSETAQRQAMSVLRGDAIQAEETQVYLRSAYIDAERAIYIDLGDRERTIIRVDAAGWRFADPLGEGPVFRRSDATQALPMPVQGVDADAARTEFAALLGWDADADEFLLTWGWLVAAWFADIPRPMLWATGGPGSGKSTRTRMILGLVDPAGELAEPPGRNARDDATKAAARFVVTYDNVASISAATSDWLCRLVTGVSIESRALYTDDDVRANIIKRAALATSVNLPYGLGPDALERLIVLKFEPVGTRLLERDLKRREEDLAPRAFAALLSDLSGTLARYGDVRKDADVVRMADFHSALMALDLHNGGRHAEAYAASVDAALTDRVDDDPFLSAVVALVRAAPDGEYWAQPAVLVQAIEEYLDAEYPFRDYRALKMPGERGIRGALQNSAQPLARVGVRVDPRVKQDGRLGIRLTYNAA